MLASVVVSQGKMRKDCYLLLRKKEHSYNSFRGVSMHIQTIMCSCGGAVNNRSKFVCTLLSLNLLLVLLLVPEQILGKVMSSEKGDLSSTSLPTLSSSTQAPESSEDETSDPDSFAYLDDDPVRFVNEDFVYEDEISHHHNNLYQQVRVQFYFFIQPYASMAYQYMSISVSMKSAFKDRDIFYQWQDKKRCTGC